MKTTDQSAPSGLTDFSRPQRMSPKALVILTVKIIKRDIGAIIAFLSLSFIQDMTSSTRRKIFTIAGILMFAAAVIIVSLAAAVISYLTKKFYVKDGNLVFMHGVISRETTLVPLDKVHSLRTEKGLWYRLLDMRGIIFDTLATRKQEIELVLDESEWQQLLSVIEKEEKPQPLSPTVPPEYNPKATVHFPTKNLIQAALCQNHFKGMAIFGSFLGLIIQGYGDLDDNATETLAGYLESGADWLLDNPWIFVPILFGLYLLSLVLWLWRVVMRYYDTTMTHDKKLLTFTYGLIKRASCRFFYNKICTIWIKRNFLEKRFGFCTLMLKQALNVSAMKEEDNLKLYGTDSSAFFLNWWLGADSLASPDVLTAKSGRGVLLRSMVLSVICIAILTVIFLCEEMYVWLLIPALWVPLAVFRGICAMRHSRITLKPSYFVIHGGAFAEISSYIKYSNLEVVGIRRTPFTRLFHRVAIVVSTSGTTYAVRSLREEEARFIYEYLLEKAEEEDALR